MFNDAVGKYRANWANTGYFMVRRFHKWHDIFKFIGSACQAYDTRISKMGFLAHVYA